MDSVRCANVWKMEINVTALLLLLRPLKSCLGHVYFAPRNADCDLSIHISCHLKVLLEVKINWVVLLECQKRFNEVCL